MAAQYKSKEATAVAVALKRPTVQNKVVHIKMPNEYDMCSVL
jgi:hypothetical protein